MKGIPVILLAAGQSRRMGGPDKLMQLVDGLPLLRRSATIAQAVGPVLVALPPAPHPRYDALEGLDVDRISIPDAAEGMNASLREAIAHVPRSADAALVLLADLPELTRDDLASVVNTVKRCPDNLIWRGATESGQPGHPVIFDKSLFGEIAKLRGDSGAQEIVKRYSDRVHLEPLPGDNAVLDLDTQEDWDIWRANRKTPTGT